MSVLLVPVDFGFIKNNERDVFLRSSLIHWGCTEVMHLDLFTTQQAQRQIKTSSRAFISRLLHTPYFWHQLNVYYCSLNAIIIAIRLEGWIWSFVLWINTTRRVPPRYDHLQFVQAIEKHVHRERATPRAATTLRHDSTINNRLGVGLRGGAPLNRRFSKSMCTWSTTIGKVRTVSFQDINETGFIRVAKREKGVKLHKRNRVFIYRNKA